jgi:transcriptional regulator with XRE-family HTH domain
MTYPELIHKIRATRLLIGLNQSQMAEKLNMTKQQYTRMERQVTTLSVPRLMEIVRILEIQILLK